MATKKRLTEKAHQPTEVLVQALLGDVAWQRLMCFEEMLQERYSLNREMKFPFGERHGWGFRYSHKKALLLYVFFEESRFCCTISINDTRAQQVEAMLGDLQPKTQDLWLHRYPCGANGGWLHYPVASDEEMLDLIQLVGVKVNPKNK